MMANRVPADLGARTLSGRTVRAGAWTVGGRLFSKSIDFVSLLILARFLGPADFGLVAMAMTTILIVEAVVELPLGAVLVREPEPTEAMFATAFTLGLIRSLAIAAILGGLAWPLSWFYHEPRLVLLVMVGALAPIMRGMVSPRMVVFQRRFDFRPFFALDVASKVVSLLVIATIAISTNSYWAIAAGTVATSASMMVVSYIMAPLRPALTVSEWHRFAPTVGWNSVSQLIQSINWQLDRIVLPRFIDIFSFGRFAVANDLVAIPHQAVAHPVGGPLMSAFVTLRSPADLKIGYLKATTGIVLVMAPIYLAIALLADPILHLMFGDKWHSTAPILCALAFTSLISLPAIPMGPLAMTQNRPHLITLKTFCEFAIKFPVMLVAIAALGINGAILAQGVAGVTVLVVSMIGVRKITGLGINEQCQALVPPGIGLMTMAATIWFSRQWLAYENVLWVEVAHLVGVLMTAVLVYLITVFAVWHARGSANTIESTIVRKLRGLLHGRGMPTERPSAPNETAV
jgi:O-antigen/teichoic acid export membrane protein